MALLFGGAEPIMLEHFCEITLNNGPMVQEEMLFKIFLMI